MRRTGLFSALALTAALAACGDHPTAPNDRTAALPIPGTVDPNAVKFWEAGATVAWNALATDLAARRPISAIRLYVYLSLAQLRAAEAANASPGPHPPTSAAIGAASASVLNSFFPLDIAEIESALDAQEAADPWPGAKHQDFAAGEAIGRAAGARVLAYAATDLVGLTDPGTPPVGPGYWLSNGGPILRGLLGARPFYLTSTDELRPPPPPAFGSPEFLSALAEVRQVADNRTAEQLAIAIYWHLNVSPTSAAAPNGIARELIVSHHRKDAEAARIMFLMASAQFDAFIGCFDAKYHYWFIRPPQADPGIITAFPTPAHPSYPSAHSCGDGAATSVLAAVFPDQRDRLAGVAQESSVSRLYAGIHYRFDMVAGLAIGRAAAAKAMAADLDAVAVR